jgi:two-component system, NarL family, nitrate/nitrite response regulator NarL
VTKSKAPFISVLVVDDHPVVIGGVRRLLDRDPEFRVIGDAGSAAEAVNKAAQLQPDVMLLDLRLPDSEIGTTAAALRTAAPDMKIVVFTAYVSPAALAQVRGAKVHGFLHKDATDEDLGESLRKVMAGESISPPGRGTRGFTPTLTRREIEVLRHIAMGYTTVEVAEELVLARTTVKSYLQSLMQKLGARNRVEAISHASEAGLL